MAELLREMSKETGEPLSPMVNGLLESLAPGLQQALDMARQVKRMDQARKETLQGHLDRLADSLESRVVETMREAEAAIKSVH